MSIAALTKLCSAKNPAFRCTAAGDRSGKEFVARLLHVLCPPATKREVAQIKKHLGEYAAPVLNLYSRHCGALLYRDTKSETAGIHLLPPGLWPEAKKQVRELLGDMVDGPDGDPDHILKGVPVATVPHSGNFFVLPVSGPNAGKVFYADHDGWYESAFAKDYDSFLAKVCKNPVKLLNEVLGCYARYEDGLTDEQWIPAEYFDDLPEPARKRAASKR